MVTPTMTGVLSLEEIQRAKAMVRNAISDSSLSESAKQEAIETINSDDVIFSQDDASEVLDSFLSPTK